MTQPLPPFVDPTPWSAPAPEPPESSRVAFLRRHRVPLIVGAGAAVLLTGAIAWGVTASSNGASTPIAGPSTQPGATGSPTSSGAGAANGQATAKKRALQRGTITGEDGTSWTMHTAAGHTLTITIGPKTAFGTAKAPATQSQFPVGTSVIVVGRLQNGSITPRRIVAAKAGG